MKDNEFIELLNLYLDHEISAENAARLESEVQRDPARRRIYHDYCRLHKACTLLAADATIEAPAVTEFASARRSWFSNIYAGAGLMAAAACAAFVFFNRAPVSNDGTALTGTAPLAVNQTTVTAPPAQAAREIPQTVTVRPRQDGFQPVVMRTRLDSNAAPNETVQDLRLNWMEKMQLSSLPQASVDSLRFETKSPVTTNPHQLGSKQSETFESAAWQFQR